MGKYRKFDAGLHLGKIFANLYELGIVSHKKAAALVERAAAGPQKPQEAFESLIAAQTLEQKLNALRVPMAASAQELWEAWEGEGTLRDDVADAMADIIDSSIPEVDVITAGDPDEPTNLLVFTADESFFVGIPPQAYEASAGGKRRGDIIIDPQDVVIQNLEMAPEELEKLQVQMDVGDWIDEEIGPEEELEIMPFILR